MNSNDLVEEAERLYDLGFHVFPIPYGKKIPYGPWKFLQVTRLHQQSFPELFERSNVAVMTGRLSENLFVVDCDTFEDYNRVSRELSKREIQTWERNSSRGGQFWFLCSDGEVANEKIGKIDILGNNKFTIAPPSLHPIGMIYHWNSVEQWLPTTVSLAELDFLNLKLKTPSSGMKLKGGSCSSSNLPPVAAQVLIHRDSSHYRGDNSSAEYAACLSLLNAGWCDEEIIRVFRHTQPPHFCKVGELNFRTHVLRPAHVRIDSSASNGESRNTPSEFYKKWADARPWPGRTGNSDKAVFIALCERMRLDKNVRFRASVREVSVLASLSLETACKSIHRLIKQGLVKREGSTVAAGAFLYSLHLPDAPAPDGGESRTVGVAYDTVRSPVRLSPDGTTPTVRLSPDGTMPTVRLSPVNHGAWHWSALGKSAYEVYKTLARGGEMTVRQVEGMTGRSERTCREVLKKLRECGLVEKKETGWIAVAVNNEVFDDLADYFGTADRTALRQENFAEERSRRATEFVLKQKAEWRG